jgi:hypothetical protein
MFQFYKFKKNALPLLALIMASLMGGLAERPIAESAYGFAAPSILIPASCGTTTVHATNTASNKLFYLTKPTI